MFDIGFIELCVLGVVALLVVGPKRLPKVAYEAGLWFGRIQRYVRSMRLEVERELHNYEIQQVIDKQKEELNDVKDLAEGISQDVHEGIKNVMEPEEKIDSIANKSKIEPND